MRNSRCLFRFSARQRRYSLSIRASWYILAQVAVFGLWFSGAVESFAANTGGVGGVFLDVPADGISYTSDVSGVNTVDVGGGAAGETTVNNKTIGIELTRTGVHGISGTVDVEFDKIIEWDTDNNSSTPLVDVVSLDGTNPYLFNGDPGEYIIVQSYDDNNTPGTFSIGTNPEIYNGTELAEKLKSNTSDPGVGITGSLTVNNNNGPSPLHLGAPFNTMNAEGIVVSSNGGNGGKGGYFTIGFWSWGFRGADGGDAGSVVVNSNSKIIVNGNDEEKHGVTAKSQGGNGGDGGGPWGLAGSTAGSGGSGGNGNEVWVILGKASDITTNGKKSYGVFAQSQGGDGGHGGDAASWGYTLGSQGGNGGDAGIVIVDNDGKINTKGLNSHGIYARSVGAGAGSGSSVGGLYAVGGSGGWTSNGNTVEVTNRGTIITEQADSFGILAQSIGGGGGDGGGAGGWFTVGGNGNSGGGSNEVTVTDSGTVQTKDDRSTAIFAQSIGGGGGNGGDAVSFSSKVSVALGGKGSLGGDGDNVTVISYGSDIDTGSVIKDKNGKDIVIGDESCGILAQSVGGGGGNGGLAISGAISAAEPISVAVALGGNGGVGGDAGDMVSVTTTSTTDINTLGSNSQGISAQSIGGGGGNGGAAFSASGGGVLNLSVSLGGEGSAGGNGKSVHIGNAATITTLGDLSAGIQAQSIGGGGGNGGMSGTLAIGGGSVGVSLGGKGGKGGVGGEVDVKNSGKITTGGKSAVGIFAQSVGGGGGNGGSAISGSAGVLAVSTAIGGNGGKEIKDWTY